MRLKTIGENQLYRAFVLGGMAEAQSHLDGLVADFNRGKAEKAAPERRGLGGVIQKWRRSMAMSSSANASAEAEEAFEAFCGRPRAGGVALAMLRNAGHILSQPSLARGIGEAARFCGEQIVREAIELVDPKLRAVVLRSAWSHARWTADAAFAARLDGWAKSLEEQDLLASLPESATPGKARAARL